MNWPLSFCLYLPFIPTKRIGTSISVRTLNLCLEKVGALAPEPNGRAVPEKKATAGTNTAAGSRSMKPNLDTGVEVDDNKVKKNQPFRSCVPLLLGYLDEDLSYGSKYWFLNLSEYIFGLLFIVRRFVFFTLIPNMNILKD